MGTENKTELPFHPKQGQRVEWDMNGKTHYGLYVEWLPYPEVLRCNHRVVSEEYGLLTFEDDGKLRPAKATELPKCSVCNDKGYVEGCWDDPCPNGCPKQSEDAPSEPHWKKCHDDCGILHPHAIHNMAGCKNPEACYAVVGNIEAMRRMAEAGRVKQSEDSADQNDARARLKRIDAALGYETQQALCAPCPADERLQKLREYLDRLDASGRFVHQDNIASTIREIIA